jgi:hypothetical protein
MCFLNPIVFLATISSAKLVTIENRVLCGNDVVDIGNTNCGQHIYHSKKKVCNSNTRVHVGDVIPKGCTSSDGHTYERMVAQGDDKMYAGDQFLRLRIVIVD